MNENINRRGFFASAAALLGFGLLRPRPAPKFPTATGGFVPAAPATNLIVGFSREPQNFKINEYVQYVGDATHPTWADLGRLVTGEPPSPLGVENTETPP